MIKLLLDANAHLDSLDAHGRQPEHCTGDWEIKILLRARKKLSLKCQCARLIVQRSVCYKYYLPTSLIAFVRMHGCKQN